MNRSLADPPVFALTQKERGLVVLTESGSAKACVFILEDDIIRVALLPQGGWRFPKTWAIAAGADDVPQSGRDRLDLTGFSCPDYSLEETSSKR